MDNAKKTLTVSTLVQLLVFIVLVPFLPLLISLKWDWLQAWVYGNRGVEFIISWLLVNKRHPDLLTECARFLQLKDTKPWGGVLARLVGLGVALIPP